MFFFLLNIFKKKAKGEVVIIWIAHFSGKGILLNVTRVCKRGTIVNGFTPTLSKKSPFQPHL